MFGERFSGRTDPPPRCPYGILSPQGDRSLGMEIILRLLRPCGDLRAQDLITYVLLAGFVAVAAAAFIFLPSSADLFSRVTTLKRSVCGLALISALPVMAQEAEYGLTLPITLGAGGMFSRRWQPDS